MESQHELSTRSKAFGYLISLGLIGVGCYLLIVPRVVEVERTRNSTHEVSSRISWEASETAAWIIISGGLIAALFVINGLRVLSVTTSHGGLSTAAASAPNSNTQESPRAESQSLPKPGQPEEGPRNDGVSAHVSEFLRRSSLGGLYVLYLCMKAKECVRSFNLRESPLSNIVSYDYSYGFLVGCISAGVVDCSSDPATGLVEVRSFHPVVTSRLLDDYIRGYWRTHNLPAQQEEDRLRAFRAFFGR